MASLMLALWQSLSYQGCDWGLRCWSRSLKIWVQIDFIKPYHDNLGKFALMIGFNIVLVMSLGLIFYSLYNWIMKYVDLIIEERKN